MVATTAITVTGPLPWQQRQWQRMHEALANDRFPHALLMTGRPGAGKRLFADALMARLLCLQVTADGQACGHCRGCRLRLADNHPDIFLLQPLPDKQEIIIDQIRALIDDLATTAQQGGYRVVIIDPAERLNSAAANSLLKVLEEPGESLLFCLLSSQAMRLPATIRSRCQHLPFPLPLAAEAEEWLRQQLPRPEQSQSLLVAAFGSPLTALQLSRREDAAENPVSAQLLALLQGQSSPVEVAASWLQAGSQETLDKLYACLAQLLRLQWVPAPATVDPVLQKLHQQLQLEGRHADALYSMLDSVHELLRLQGTSLNQSLLFEALAIQWLTTE